MSHRNPPWQDRNTHSTAALGASSVLYFDNNGSTVPYPDVVEAVARAMVHLPANASASHLPAREALEAVEDARVSLANSIGARPSEIVFTSGATEANNLAIRGVAQDLMTRGSQRSHRRRVLVGATEHPSVLLAASSLRALGFQIEVIPVSNAGLHDVEFVNERLDDAVALVAVMLANNETGVVSDLLPIVRRANEVGALTLCDATQAVGRVPVVFRELDVDFLSVSGHKIHGPKGVGALVVRRGAAIAPTQYGGNHERSLRAGTLNTPSIVGFGVAADAVEARLESVPRMKCLRDHLVSSLIQGVPDTELVAAAADRLPNTANVRFRGADAEAVLAGMPSVAASTGAACSSGNPEPSHVLMAMGMKSLAATECVRFSLDDRTSLDAVERLVELTRQSVERVRDMTLADK